MLVLRKIYIKRVVTVMFSCLVVFGAAEIVRASTIGGLVYDSKRNPVVEIDVELLDTNYSTRNRTKTDGVGRYQFHNVDDGRYFVRVLAFRHNFEDKTEEIQVSTFSLLGGGNSYFPLDVYLSLKKGGLSDTTTGVVFAQEVPAESEGLYKRALEDIANKKSSDGMNNLISALKIFPGYYAATQQLGMELLKTEQYVDAAKLFIKSAGINPKSSKAFYYMGFALNRIGKDYNKASLEALKKAAFLAPSSFEVVYLMGKIERQSGDFIESEKHLLMAKKLSSSSIPEIHVELAQLYGNDLKRFADAANELEQYLKASNKKDKKIEQQIADLRLKAKKNG